MSLESVKKYIKENNLDLEVTQLDMSTATVQLAAEALGVEPARIAKTIAVKLKDRYILIIAKGDVLVNNRKFKDIFKEKLKFMSPEEIEDVTGHPIGGVCPFGLNEPLEIYLDISLKEFDYVYPAAGAANACLRIEVDYLKEVTSGIWIDVCK